MKQAKIKCPNCACSITVRVSDKDADAVGIWAASDKIFAAADEVFKAADKMFAFRWPR